MRLRVPQRRMTKCPIKFQCLLVDDHALVRRGFRRILEDEADIYRQSAKPVPVKMQFVSPTNSNLK